MSDVDRFELELYALGEVTDPERVRRVEEAIAGPLADAWAALECDRAAWNPAPLPLPTAVERGGAGAPGSSWRGWALAAAVVLAMLGVFSAQFREAPEPGVRAMGTLPVDAYAEGGTLGALTAGDVLGVRTTLPQAGVVAVGLVQPGNGAQLLWVSEPAEAGTEVTLPAGLELDEYSGEEWLVLSLHRSLPTEEAWITHARDFVATRATVLPARAVLLREGPR